MKEQELLDKIYENKEQRTEILSRKNFYNDTNIKDLIEFTGIEINGYIESDLPHLPKGIRQQTRLLKAQARKILKWSDEEIKELFEIKKLKSKEKINETKSIELNEIKSDGDLYTGKFDSYQIEILDKLFDFDWGNSLEINGNKSDNPTHRNMYLKKKQSENEIGNSISLTNHYNGLEYIKKDIPKEGTELFIISKLIKEKIIELKNFTGYLKYNSIYLDHILNNEIGPNKASNNDLYNYIINTNIGNNINSAFSKLNEYLNNIRGICVILKEKYPEFQMPINFEEQGYNSEEYKKGLVFENFEKIRKEYARK